MFEKNKRWILRRDEKSHTGKAKILCKNCGKKFAASKSKHHGLVYLTTKNIDKTNLDDEFVPMAQITRYDKF